MGNEIENPKLKTRNCFGFFRTPRCAPVRRRWRRFSDSPLKGARISGNSPFEGDAGGVVESPSLNGMFRISNFQNICLFICLILLNLCSACQAAGQRKNADDILIRLISPDEKERFSAMEEAKNQPDRIVSGDIEKILKMPRKKNLSTLIFVLMEKRDNLIYEMSFPARKAVENSEGSFPNIAYYYARIRPRKGLRELYRLYQEHGDQRLTISKAMGETALPEAANFLMTEVFSHRNSGNSAFAPMAGLSASGVSVDKDKILRLLGENLDREEVILLSNLRTEFTQSDLMLLYEQGNKRKQGYVIQRIFREPARNFKMVRFVTEQAIEKGREDRAMEWMMSDTVRRCDDEQVRRYRKSVLERIRSQRKNR